MRLIKYLFLLLPFFAGAQNLRISDMPLASDVTSAYVPIVQLGINKKASASLFGTTYTANSGVQIIGSVIQLGGNPLIKHTEISQNGHDFKINGVVGAMLTKWDYNHGDVIFTDDSTSMYINHINTTNFVFGNTDSLNSGGGVSVGYTAVFGVGHGIKPTGNGSFMNFITGGYNRHNDGQGDFMMGQFNEMKGTGYGSTIGNFAGGMQGKLAGDCFACFVWGSNPTPDSYYKPTLVANGLVGAVNISHNSKFQTTGHGVNSNYAAILGGTDHNIPSNATNAAVFGGRAIKMSAGDSNTVALPKVKMFQGLNASAVTDNAQTNLMVWDSGTGLVKLRTVSSITSGFVTSVSGTANRITSTGGATPVIDISASYAGQSSITTLGTITTGVWNGSTIAVINGGTGTSSPSLVSGTSISITGSWPNQTVSFTGAGGSVTSVGITDGSNITHSGGPITTSGNITVNAIPSGSANNVQYSNGTNFVGSNNFTYNGTTLTVTNGAINSTDGGSNVVSFQPATVLIGSASNKYTISGATWVCNTTSTFAGLNVGIFAGDPSPVNNGDVWYNSTTNKFRARENGTTVNAINLPAGSGRNFQFNNGGVFGALNNFTWGTSGSDHRMIIANDALTQQIYLGGSTAGAFISMGDGGSNVINIDANSSGGGDNILVDDGTKSISITTSGIGQSRASQSLVLNQSGGSQMVFTSDGRFYGTALHNNAGSVTGTSNHYVASGTYTPTITNGTNVASSSATGAQWIRVGNVVTVSGFVTVTPTSANVGTVFNLSLPIAISGNFSLTSDLAGSGGYQNNTTTSDYSSVLIFTNNSSSNAICQFVPLDTGGGHGISFTFTYLMK